MELLAQELTTMREKLAAAEAAPPPVAAVDNDAVAEAEVPPDADGLPNVTVEARLKHRVMLLEAKNAEAVMKSMNALGKVEGFVDTDRVMTSSRVLNIEDVKAGAMAAMADSADKQAALTRYAALLLGAAPNVLGVFSNKTLRTVLRELFGCANFVSDHEVSGEATPQRVVTNVHYALQRAKILNMYGDAPRPDQMANKVALSYMNSSMDDGAFPNSEFALPKFMVAGSRDGLREENASNSASDGLRTSQRRLGVPKTRTDVTAEDKVEALKVFFTSLRFLQADDVANPGQRHGQIGEHVRLASGSFLNFDLRTENRVMEVFSDALRRGVGPSPLSDVVDDFFEALRADTRPPVNKTINFAIDGRLGQVKDTLRYALSSVASKAAQPSPDNTAAVRDLRRELTDSKRSLAKALSPTKDPKKPKLPPVSSPKGSGRAEGSLGPNKLATGALSPRMRGGNPDAPEPCHNKTCGAGAICSFNHSGKGKA